jgi:hypothetical protein
MLYVEKNEDFSDVRFRNKNEGQLYRFAHARLPIIVRYLYQIGKFKNEYLNRFVINNYIMILQ